MLIGFFEFITHFFSENLSALFTSEDHFVTLLKLMILGGLVAFGAVEPFLAAWGSDCYLGVHNVFAHGCIWKF